MARRKPCGATHGLAKQINCRKSIKNGKNTKAMERSKNTDVRKKEVTAKYAGEAVIPLC